MRSADLYSTAPRTAREVFAVLRGRGMHLGPPQGRGGERSTVPRDAELQMALATIRDPLGKRLAEAIAYQMLSDEAMRDILCLAVPAVAAEYRHDRDRRVRALRKDGVLADRIAKIVPAATHKLVWPDRALPRVRMRSADYRALYRGVHGTLDTRASLAERAAMRWMQSKWSA